MNEITRKRRASRKIRARTERTRETREEVRNGTRVARGRSVIPKDTKAANNSCSVMLVKSIDGCVMRFVPLLFALFLTIPREPRMTERARGKKEREEKRTRSLCREEEF